ncbi:MAG: translation initiation factor IF-3 [Candidatus Spechtbacterales bacterium]
MSKIRHRKRPQESTVKRPSANHQIRAASVRLIDEKGENRGIVTKDEALKIADSAQLDLIEISPNADPPVARIMDLGKYMYEAEKKEREGKKKQKDSNVIKGVRISMRMSPHDIENKAKNVDKFLKKGYKVRVEVLMRGREKGLAQLADERIKSFLASLTEPYKIEQAPQKQPRGLALLIAKA